MAADNAAEIRRLLDPILVSLGLSLWDIEFQKSGPKWLLRVYIDREGTGVTLNDCETVSRDLSAILDVEDLIQHAYTLEVSSPGLDRTLSKPEHFVRFTGSLVRIKTYEPIAGEKVFRGKLASAEGDSITLALADDKTIEVSKSNIAKASLEPEF
jgi:ribosome maturation factor RimP